MLSKVPVNWSAMEPTFNRKMSRIFSTMDQVAEFLRLQGYIHEAIEVLDAMSWGTKPLKVAITHSIWVFAMNSLVRSARPMSIS